MAPCTSPPASGTNAAVSREQAKAAAAPTAPLHRHLLQREGWAENTQGQAESKGDPRLGQQWKHKDQVSSSSWAGTQ